MEFIPAHIPVCDPACMSHMRVRTYTRVTYVCASHTHVCVRVTRAREAFYRHIGTKGHKKVPIEHMSGLLSVVLYHLRPSVRPNRSSITFGPAESASLSPDSVRQVPFPPSVPSGSPGNFSFFADKVYGSPWSSFLRWLICHIEHTGHWYAVHSALHFLLMWSSASCWLP